jgi:pimeloyl-ACP methyl ester carboxylesterase
VRPIIEDSNALKLLSEADREEVGEILVQTTSYIKSITEKVRAAVAPASELADAAFLSPIRENPKRYRLSFDPDASDVLCKGPSLIITGRHDASVGYRDAWRLVGKLPRSTYVVLDRAEHGLPIDQHDLFAALVRDWLARVSEMQL